MGCQQSRRDAGVAVLHCAGWYGRRCAAHTDPNRIGPPAPTACAQHTTLAPREARRPPDLTAGRLPAALAAQ